MMKIPSRNSHRQERNTLLKGLQDGFQKNIFGQQGSEKDAPGPARHRASVQSGPLASTTII